MSCLKKHSGCQFSPLTSRPGPWRGSDALTRRERMSISRLSAWSVVLLAHGYNCYHPLLPVKGSRSPSPTGQSEVKCGGTYNLYITSSLFYRAAPSCYHFSPLCRIRKRLKPPSLASKRRLPVPLLALRSEQRTFTSKIQVKASIH